MIRLGSLLQIAMTVIKVRNQGGKKDLSLMAHTISVKMPFGQTGIGKTTTQEVNLGFSDLL